MSRDDLVQWLDSFGYSDSEEKPNVFTKKYKINEESNATSTVEYRLEEDVLRLYFIYMNQDTLRREGVLSNLSIEQQALIGFNEVQ